MDAAGSDVEEECDQYGMLQHILLFFKLDFFFFSQSTYCSCYNSVFW